MIKIAENCVENCGDFYERFYEFVLWGNLWRYKISEMTKGVGIWLVNDI